MQTLDNLFEYEDATPYRTVYETAHQVVNDYLKYENRKISYMAEKLGIGTSLLYKKLDPKQTHKPLSIDLAIDITRITGDNRILNAMENVVTDEEEIESDPFALNMKAVDLSVVLGEFSKEVLTATEDDEIDDDEKKRIRKALNGIIKEANEALKFIS